MSIEPRSFVRYSAHAPSVSGARQGENAVRSSGIGCIVRMLKRLVPRPHPNLPPAQEEVKTMPWMNRLGSLFRCFLFFLLGGAWLGAAQAALDIEQWTTPQGTRVLFVQNHDLPMLDVAVHFAAGSVRDTPERAGLANLTQAMMALGAGPWSEREIAERLADVGAQLSSHFDRDRAGFNLRTLSSPPWREPALAVLAAILARPHFDAAVLERERVRALARLAETNLRPEVIGSRAFYAALYGEHPYALPESGSETGIAAIRREDLVEFHARHYRAANAVIALMGDISREEAARIAETLTAGLPKGDAPELTLPVVVRAQGSEQVIPHHATQSHVFIGALGMKRDDPDFFPLVVGNYILGGGGFDSRILDEIRQKRGLAYSAYSYFMPLADLGPFLIGVQTQRESTAQALQVARETVRRFVREGPSEAELAQAKNHLVGSFPLRLDSNRKILDHLAMIGFYRLPLDWLARYSESVEAVSREAVMQAFRRRIDPEALHVVVVGGQIDAGAR